MGSIPSHTTIFADNQPPSSHTGSKDGQKGYCAWCPPVSQNHSAGPASPAGGGLSGLQREVVDAAGARAARDLGTEVGGAWCDALALLLVAEMAARAARAHGAAPAVHLRRHPGLDAGARARRAPLRPTPQSPKRPKAKP